jgi:hypothetical protein
MKFKSEVSANSKAEYHKQFTPKAVWHTQN